MELIEVNEITEVTQIEKAIKIESLIDSFVEAQDIKANSRLLYKRTLKQYFIWIEENALELDTLTRTSIINYKEDLLSKGMSSLSVGSYVNSVRRFYEWAEANKLYPNIARGVRTPKRKQQFKKQALLPEQAKELLAYYENKDPRDFAIISLLLRTGLRTVEVVRANIEDITFKDSQRVLLVQGKGRDEKDNFVVITDKTYKALETYLKTRGKVNSSEPLFISSSNNSKGERLTTRTISYIAKEGLKAIGLDNRGYTAHSLRHTGATNILRATGDLEQTRLFCRHTNPATTLVYTETIKEERRLKNSGEAVLDNLY